MPQLGADKEQSAGSSMLNTDDFSTSETTSNKGLAPSVLNCCSSVHYQPLRNIMEENIRMRQAMNSMVLTLNRWIHQNKEQTEQVKLLVNTLKESEEQKEKEQKELRQKLEAMTIQMKARESDLATERQNRLQSDREKEVAKQMILKLQQENWGLRKARSRALISRDSSYSVSGFSSQPSTSMFDSPD
ncbi:uncharacterized protein LOC124210104 [Daphnia pulex]|uniref:Uncharacterized protein n=1 Tax=Daphnia pulex TaxID=6669 RepID=E9H247_DAPPU|nr:uncharacterized protein LOC124210104 [Daphnia pulex]EFX74100.1 hypothetical protein DAPPUDRAFT_307459 [Daphnia pulex]|eukprot:EFX74100.1 hypothetical protein DAPPUDRAFT_307459 [Daphnia pulex]